MNHRILLLLLLGACLALARLTSAANVSVNVTEWELWKMEHGKNYATEEEDSLRSIIFAHNKRLVGEFNARKSSKVGFKLGLNQFADLDESEMSPTNSMAPTETRKGWREEKEERAQGSKFLEQLMAAQTIEVPDELDWRQVPGRVTRVKDQGPCKGGDFAFSATGALEGQQAARSNKSDFGARDLVELSEQNLLDCVKTSNCVSGFTYDAYDTIHEEGGINSASDYPYEGTVNKCRFDKAKSVITDSDWELLYPSYNEEKLKEFVAKFGPVPAIVDASDETFRWYKNGIYHSDKCSDSPFKVNQHILIVGYGTDPKQGDYWIVKNSWGTTWGQDGYILLSRNRGNNCGIATTIIYPTF